MTSDVAAWHPASLPEPPIRPPLEPSEDDELLVPPVEESAEEELLLVSADELCDEAAPPSGSSRRWRPTPRCPTKRTPRAG